MTNAEPSMVIFDCAKELANATRSVEQFSQQGATALCDLRTASVDIAIWQEVHDDLEPDASGLARELLPLIGDCGTDAVMDATDIAISASIYLTSWRTAYNSCATAVLELQKLQTLTSSLEDIESRISVSTLAVHRKSLALWVPHAMRFAAHCVRDQNLVRYSDLLDTPFCKAWFDRVTKP